MAADERGLIELPEGRGDFAVESGRWRIGMRMSTLAVVAMVVMPGICAAQSTQPANAPLSMEEVSRSVLALKAQRAEVAKRVDSGDPEVKALDLRLAQLRHALVVRQEGVRVGRAGPGSEPTATTDIPIAGAQLFRRIVETPDPMPSAEGTAADEEDSDQRAAPPEKTADNSPIRKQLSAKMSLSVKGAGLEPVLADFARRSRVNMNVNWKALEAAGIDGKTPVTVDLNDVAAWKVLNTVLAEVGGGTANLGYTKKDGVLEISTRDDLNSARYQVVKVYDVRDLIRRPFSALPPQMANDFAQQQSTALCDTIKATVAPDTWRDNGGTIGSIRELNGQLIINQTQENHDEIVNLLGQFRRR
jgi:hypothetical protein